MVKKLLVAPSSDPCSNDEDLLAYVKQIQSYADYFHVDCMDGEFVPKKTINHEQVKLLFENSLIRLDVHLMECNPDVDAYIKAGANSIIVHYESFKSKKELLKVLKHIKSKKIKAGISLKPSTDIKRIFDFLPVCDQVLVMSVEPGKSGQKFLVETLERIKSLKEYITLSKLSIQIEVDGGINPQIACQLNNFGADIIVSGSYMYNAQDKKKAIELLRGVINQN